MTAEGTAKGLRSWTPLLVAVGVVMGVLLIAILVSVHMNDGRFVYALDDAYIHLAMAENLAKHGVWGVTPYEFGSGSSSPFYTLFLAGAFSLTGTVVLLPLAVNILATVALLAILTAVFRDNGYKRWSSAGLALGIVLLWPSTPLIMGGMEHSLHVLGTIGFVWMSARLLSQKARGTLVQRAGLVALATVLPLIRYESLALILTVTLLLVARKRRLTGIACGIGAIASVTAFGLYSRAMGDFFLPNPLLIKTPEFRLVPTFIHAPVSPGGHFAYVFFSTAVLMTIALAQDERFWRQEVLWPVMAIASTVAHFQFGGFGLFHRYEAYLVVLMYTALAVVVRTIEIPTTWLASVRDLRRRPALLAAAVLSLSMLFAPSLYRATKAHLETPRATNNIYAQHVQMARFLERYHNTATIAANDIGAISFMTDIRLLDLVGLADGDVVRVLDPKTRDITPEAMEVLARERGVTIAFAHTGWFPNGIPDEWTKVGTLHLQDNIVSGSANVEIFSVGGDQASAERLRSELAEFSTTLPPAASITIE